jgi:mannonate dehydratase
MMELNIAEIILESRPSPFWRILKQMGVNMAVGVLPRAFNDWRQNPEEDPWDYGPLTRYRNMLQENGLQLVAIEDNPPMDAIRYGMPTKEQQLDAVARMLENMGKLGIKLWCYNWMAGLGWSRTRTHVRGPNGEFVTAFDIKDVEGAPPPKMGKVDAATLWRTLKDFLEYVIPIAEKYGIQLAMHPDDPPIPEYRGVSRIMNSVESYDRLLSLVRSPYNGITLCQGNFTLMTDDLPSVIRHFGGKVFFVHFRDVVGNKYQFTETMIGRGKTDLVEVMRAYGDVNYSGIMRVDHTPTLEGDTEFTPGYSYLGRIYSIGYLRALYDSMIRQRSIGQQGGA